MIYILYSDDYEVYLGGNYYPERDVLIARGAPHGIDELNDLASGKLKVME